jgi:hypothetical protein
MTNDPTKPLRFETAASIILADTLKQFFHTFAHVVRADRVAGKACTATMIDGLAGTMALVIAGGHGSKEDVLESTIAKLREAVDRDLRHQRAKLS